MAINDLNNTNVNPFQMIQFVKSQKNPEQFMLNVLKGYTGQNPVLINIINLAEQNKTKEIEQVARNLFKEKGLDFDKEFNNFRQQFGL